jgi:hypothetical protein
MILIAVIAVASAVLRSARREPFVFIPPLLIIPAILMTEIRAKRRRDRGLRMSAWERVVAVTHLTIGLVALLVFAFELIVIAKPFLFR